MKSSSENERQEISNGFVNQVYSISVFTSHFGVLRLDFEARTSFVRNLCDTNYWIPYMIRIIRFARVCKHNENIGNTTVAPVILC